MYNTQKNGYDPAVVDKLKKLNKSSNSQHTLPLEIDNNGFFC